MRIHITKNGISRVILFKPKKYEFINGIDLFPYEKELSLTKVPIYRELDAKLDMYLPFCVSKCSNPKLWSWYFDYSNAEIYLSLLSDDTEVFQIEDLDILRLFVETFSGKYQQLILRRELEKNNKNLRKALKEIEKKNEEINSIISHQKEIIRKRTKSIKEKNNMLLEMISVNSHNVREPLTRILGLLDTCDTTDCTELVTVILPYLKASAQDLDTIIKATIAKSYDVVNNKKFE
ncbi:hypothetical protein Y10_22570 [Neptunitalea sp. Y10]|uniref:Uncharacterized protein n=2 Tax=Neptunitalea lumnitzerae TaxID=2965509 RepID=A0ABQ5MKG6_9FLAO|nr:hypothetical protein Y10_22570 [Neptunitalea sp. Y10]